MDERISWSRASGLPREGSCCVGNVGCEMAGIAGAGAGAGAAVAYCCYWDSQRNHLMPETFDSLCICVFVYSFIRVSC